MKTDKGIAPAGAILKTVSPLPYEKAQRLLGPLSDRLPGLLPLKSLNCEKVFIPRADGTPMRVCVMRGKKTGGKTVGVLWLHGGGYALGAPELAFMTLPRFLVRRFNCVVVAPAYTLSSKKPYPAALEDAFSALLWLKENRAALGIDCEKLVVGGESAGGGLTAALSLYARDRGEDVIGLMIPLYPMLDDRPTATSACNTAPVWNTRANKAAWRIYLGAAAGGKDVPCYAAPARAEDLRGLPPAISFVGTLEPFYAETLAFFDRLRQAGIETSLGVYEGAYHAFDMAAPYAGISRRAVRVLLEQYGAFTEKYTV